MAKLWQLQEAKNRLSEVVDKAVSFGPQTITRHGKATAVVLSYEDFKRMNRSRGGLAEFFRSSPLHGLDLDLSRHHEAPRETDI